ncbi:MAG: Maf family nucleotide pyrophosphatase [Chromatiales bacterium]|nr:Maf family nucleotide pyrophosphatase [Chromatiales bacterium]
MSRRLVLASTSPFRRELVTRFGLPFECVAPDVDETRLPGESPSAMVRRLAEAKARAVADRFPDALIIGSDQCAALGETILGKPGSHERAIEQLRACSGRRVMFHIGLCLLDTANGHVQLDEVLFPVRFRHLSEAQIDGYLRHDQPYNCAGSFRSERLGIALFEALEGSDPTALMGLPLIRLTAMLGAAGLDVLTATADNGS